MNNVKTKTVFVNCVFCKKEFEVSIYRKDTAMYCSRSCKDASQKGRAAWNKGLTQEQYTRKEVVLTNVCLNCGTPVVKKFCGHSCQRSYQNKRTKGVGYVERYGENKAADIRHRMSKNISKTARQTHFTKKGASVVGKMRRGKTLEQIYGVQKADIMKESIIDKLHTFSQTEKGKIVRQKASERNVRYILSGRTFANTKKGLYEGVYFDSSLEQSFLKEWHRILGSLKNIKRNKTVVLSRSDSFHKTVPDYVVVDDNNVVIGLIECKWERYMKTDLTYDKAVALFEYGKEQKIQTGYFTYQTLKQFKNLQGNPEPRRLNSLISLVVKELQVYVVSRKVQRLSVENKEINKTLKVDYLEKINPNYPFPINLENDIVRHPVKIGVCL